MAADGQSSVYQVRSAKAATTTEPTSADVRVGRDSGDRGRSRAKTSEPASADAMAATWAAVTEATPLPEGMWRPTPMVAMPAASQSMGATRKRRALLEWRRIHSQ